MGQLDEFWTSILGLDDDSKTEKRVGLDELPDKVDTEEQESSYLSPKQSIH